MKWTITIDVSEEYFRKVMAALREFPVDAVAVSVESNLVPEPPQKEKIPEPQKTIRGSFNGA